MLQVIDDRLYAGYGDYDLNTGPIHVESVPVADPLAAWVDEGIAVTTEQISGYRQLADGRVMAAHVDPQGATGGGYAERALDGTWHDRSNRIATDAFHVFDIVEFDGHLFACGSVRTEEGSDDGTACVWASTDGGDTWAESLRSTFSDPSEYARFYGFVIADGLRVHDRSDDATWKWNGSGWSPDAVRPFSDNFFDGGFGIPWNGGYLSPGSVPLGTRDNLLSYFDGTTATVIVTDGLAGYSVGDDGALYVLLRHRKVKRALPQHPVVLSDLFTVPFTAPKCGICVLPGSTQAVIGRTDSRIELVDLP